MTILLNILVAAIVGTLIGLGIDQLLQAIL